MRLLPVAGEPLAPRGLLAGGVIDQARRRQRHRRVGAVLVLAGLGTAVLGYLSTGPRHIGGTGPLGPAPAAEVDAPSLVLASGPELGCYRLNSLQSPPCRKIALAVWLKRPAVSVAARVSGLPMSLEPAGAQYAKAGTAKMFAGFLESAALPKQAGGVNWQAIATYMVNPPLKVQLVVNYGHGSVIAAMAQAPLESTVCMY